MNQTASVAFHFNCRIETAGLLEVTGSNGHYESVNISEMVQDMYVVTTENQ